MSTRAAEDWEWRYLGANWALRHLVDVCERMDLDNQMERPTEIEYQSALAVARSVLYAVPIQAPPGKPKRLATLAQEHRRAVMTPKVTP